MFVQNVWEVELIPALLRIKGKHVAKEKTEINSVAEENSTTDKEVC
jgi:hypothetical protein